MKRNPKTAYAQSSDIKSRTYLEYRRDMKRKAIAELEAKDWIQQIVQEEYHDKHVRVNKSGGDRFLWFLRGGGITREPDFIVEIDGQQLEIEFQYAEAANLQFYDFKVSKVASKNRGQQRRVPKENVLFLYIDKPTQRYALLSAEWIVQNGQMEEVAAWRSQAYRVPAEVFCEKLKPHDGLSAILRTIECKNRILEFQYTLLDIVRTQLAHRITEAVENEQSFTIVPGDLKGFFEACFIMAALQQIPKDPQDWLWRAILFAKSARSLREIFLATYCLDFLYFLIPENESISEIKSFAETIRCLMNAVNNCYSDSDGSYRSDDNVGPCLETRYALFVINSLEDLIQDMLFYHKTELEKQNIDFNPIQKIYQNLKDPTKTAEFIRQCDAG